MAYIFRMKNLKFKTTLIMIKLFDVKVIKYVCTYISTQNFGKLLGIVWKIPWGQIWWKVFESLTYG